MDLSQVGHRIKQNGNKDKDKVYTPEEVAKDCMNTILYKIKESDHLFEPFYGKGAFYDLFPDKNPKDFTEIDLGLDFFDIPNDFKTTYILTNPPYSIITQIIKKMMELQNLKGFGLLVNNLTMTPLRLKTLENNGFYPTDLYIFKVHKWFGYCNFWFFEKLNDKPKVNVTFKEKQYMKC